ncbi:MAG: HAMP domain-containing sensor histidine kinase [Kiritimatiellia bacterium]|nr:HAMP domain-containing sensor histidine kinase [Kiritimatiellia bacterium]MDP6630078.1 HAMP domain-containing sensor histidine kinase [Kiritimatiellia bacterium]MDP6811237.1 HAMP domain-containing sensor histidine kinase [Kiritimatiellia bacterium]MDP7024590.1 HAMP domain-containing sensor histidine kinase [Kiritimatiellia bacterium]
MATFELTAQQDTLPAAPTGWAGLESRDLLRNARWFTRIRWAIIAGMALACLLQTVWPQLLAFIGVCLPVLPLIMIAIGLTATNLLYILLLRRYSDTTRRRKLFINLWMQILLDLAALTFLVHLAGSITTFVSLAYLFHIVLACIFFAPPYSLLVTLLSGLLFICVVVLELTGVLSPCNILINTPACPRALASSLLHALSAIVFWLAVWYLVAFIAQALRKRDRQLAEANHQLLLAEEANNRQVLRTTHDLKAPFSGIESNTQLLRTLHWKELSEPVREIIARIDTRSAALRERIKDILVLGAIKSQEQTGTASTERIDIPALVASVVTDLEDKAAHRGITVATAGAEGAVYSSPTHLKTLLDNLASNAIFYSHDEGTVRITITADSERAVTVSIADQGIGIREDALPSIFDEYYRTREASQHNKMSTGLGLAIVKRIANNLDIAIRVHSEIGIGTTFDVVIPRRTSNTNPAAAQH